MLKHRKHRLVRVFAVCVCVKLRFQLHCPFEPNRACYCTQRCLFFVMNSDGYVRGLFISLGQYTFNLPQHGGADKNDTRECGHSGSGPVRSGDYDWPFCYQKARARAWKRLSLRWLC